MKRKETEDVKVIEETMEGEYKKRRAIPKEIKDIRDKNVFRNLLFAIGIEVYFILLNLGYYYIEKSVYTRDTVLFSFVTLLVTIILFERAYRTEKGYYAVNIQGGEPFYVSSFSMFDGNFSEKDLSIASMIGIITPVGIVSCGIVAAILAGLGVFIEIKRQQI